MKGRRVPALPVKHIHTWVAAGIPGVFAVGCHCGALVEVQAHQLQADGVRFRFRCLRGSDRLVADADFPQLATALGLLGPGTVYAGRPRAVAA
jgi:hypothetical protein